MEARVLGSADGAATVFAEKSRVQDKPADAARPAPESCVAPRNTIEVTGRHGTESYDIDNPPDILSTTHGISLAGRGVRRLPSLMDICGGCDLSDNPDLEALPGEMRAHSLNLKGSRLDMLMKGRYAISGEVIMPNGEVTDGHGFVAMLRERGPDLNPWPQESPPPRYNPKVWGPKGT